MTRRTPKSIWDNPYIIRRKPWKRKPSPFIRSPNSSFSPYNPSYPSRRPYSSTNPLTAIPRSVFKKLKSVGLARGIFDEGTFGKRNVQIYVNYAPTSKGKCFKCRIRIVKGTPRGWYYDKMNLKGGKVPKSSKWASGNTMTVKRLLCFDCVVKQLKSTRSQYKQFVEDYTKRIKRVKRMSSMKKAIRALDTQKLMNALK